MYPDGARRGSLWRTGMVVGLWPASIGGGLGTPACALGSFIPQNRRLQRPERHHDRDHERYEDDNDQQQDLTTRHRTDS